MIRRAWTADDEALLRWLYPDWPAAGLVHVMGRTAAAIRQRALLLGIGKSAAYLAANARGQFRPGLVPHNKGLRRPGWAPGRMRETQFKPGRAPQTARNYRPIGSLRVDKDGRLARKVTDDTTLAPARRWRAEHALVWEAAHGPIPAGHIVVFRPGCHTTDPRAITPDKLELITRAENMRRNSIHTRLPPEVVDLVRLRNALQRRINNRSPREQQDV